MLSGSYFLKLFLINKKINGWDDASNVQKFRIHSKQKKTWSETGIENDSECGGNSKKIIGGCARKNGGAHAPPNNRKFIIFRTSYPQIYPQEIGFKKCLIFV